MTTAIGGGSGVAPEPGLLSVEEFLDGAQAWASSLEVRQAWDSYGRAMAGWEWSWELHKAPPSTLAPPYLKLSFLAAPRKQRAEGDIAAGTAQDAPDRELPDVNMEGEEEEEEEGLGAADPHDPAALPAHVNETASLPPVVAWEFHIVYSSIWRTPVLYLTCCLPEGKPLPWDTLEALLPADFHGTDEASSLAPLAFDRWTTLTQDDHPALGVPFYMLHPCETSARMAKLLLMPSPSPMSTGQRGFLYLLRWLSLVGPTVGLSLPPPAFHALQQVACSSLTP